MKLVWTWNLPLHVFFEYNPSFCPISDDHVTDHKTETGNYFINIILPSRGQSHTILLNIMVYVNPCKLYHTDTSMSLLRSSYHTVNIAVVMCSLAGEPIIDQICKSCQLPPEKQPPPCKSFNTVVLGPLSPCASETLTMDGCPQEWPNLKAS